MRLTLYRLRSLLGQPTRSVRRTSGFVQVAKGLPIAVACSEWTYYRETGNLKTLKDPEVRILEVVFSDHNRTSPSWDIFKSCKRNVGFPVSLRSDL